MIVVAYRRSRSRCATRRAFSLLEVVISTLIVGVMLVAAMKCAGSAISGQTASGERTRADLLARALVAEIIEQAYEEPDEVPVFGPETGDSDGNTRTNFDDVDDYNGWNASPPTAKDGTPLPNLTGWERHVYVQYVDPDDLTKISLNEQDVKRVTVTVTRNGADVASLVTIMTNAW